MQKIEKRAKILLNIFLIWGVCIILYLFYHAVITPKKYLNKSKSFSTQSGVIPAPRGKIYDKNKKLLAWSVWKYNVMFDGINIRKTTEVADKLKQLLNDSGVNCKLENGSMIVGNLTLEQLGMTIELGLLKDMKITAIPSRKYLNNKTLNEYIGRTVYEKNDLLGVSGIEKIYNDHLTGTPGKFRVMKDKNGKWLKSSWQEIIQMKPGEDLYLNKTYHEMTLIHKPIALGY